MLYIIKSYFTFLWNSKNEHAVHSPFVFHLITKCFYDKKQHDGYSLLKKYRDSLLNNPNTIEVTDFGAGSRIFKSNIRSIAKIAATAGITSKRAELLFRITNYFKPENILEIGTSLGLASSAMALGNTNSNITSVEGCPQTAGIAARQFTEFGLTNINSTIIEFNYFLQNIDHATTHYDLIYFDGNHQKEATLDYFDLLIPTITNDSVWIFDDIHWSPGMQQAWQIIKKHPKVTVTVDTFQWGFVFFRREQPKEHFVIRI